MWTRWALRLGVALIVTAAVSAAGSGTLQADSPGDAAPSAHFAAPSSAIGDLGANLGNVWDMDSTDDVVWTQENFPVEARPSSEGTIVRGFIPAYEVLGIGFYGSSTTPIDTQRYHHVVYRLKISSEGCVGICRTNGRVGYSTNFPLWYGSHTTSWAIAPHYPPMDCFVGDWCVYYLDLSRNDNCPTWPTWHYATDVNTPSPWPSAKPKGFAILPHEWCLLGGSPDYFDVDYVYLTGDIVAREEDGYTYLAKWSVSDADSSTYTTTVTSTIRYQAAYELKTPDESPTCDSTSFYDGSWTDFDPVVEQSLTLAPAATHLGPYHAYLPVISRTSGNVADSYNQTYTLDFSDDATFNDGTSYYLCVEVDDGSQRSYAVSNAPVIRVPLPPTILPD